MQQEMRRIYIYPPTQPQDALESDEREIKDERIKESLLRRGAEMLEIIWKDQVLPAIKEAIENLTQSPSPPLTSTSLSVRRDVSSVFVLHKEEKPTSLRAECSIIADNVTKYKTATIELILAARMKYRSQTQKWTISDLTVYGTLEQKDRKAPYNIPLTYLLSGHKDVPIQNVKEELNYEQVEKLAKHIILAQNATLSEVERWADDVWQTLQKIFAHPIVHTTPESEETITATVKVSPHFSIEGETIEHEDVQGLVVRICYDVTLYGTKTKYEHNYTEEAISRLEEETKQGGIDLKLVISQFASENTTWLNILMEFFFGDYNIQEFHLMSIQLPYQVDVINLPEPESIFSGEKIKDMKDFVIDTVKWF